MDLVKDLLPFRQDTIVPEEGFIMEEGKLVNKGPVVGKARAITYTSKCMHKSSGACPKA